MEPGRFEKIEDPLKLFAPSPSTSDSYSANMDRLFADDEKRSGSEEKVEESEKSASATPPREKSVIYHTGTAFWKNPAASVSKNVGYVLSEKKSEQQVCLVIYDKEKTVLTKCCIDDVQFKISYDDLSVSISVDEPVTLAFIDEQSLKRFLLHTLIHSSTHQCFILSEGSGDREIGPDTSILYDRFVHKIDDNALRLPEIFKNFKTKLTTEKLENNVVYRWLRGLKKGCLIYAKKEEGEVHEILVNKVKNSSIELDQIPPEEIPDVVVPEIPSQEPESCAIAQDSIAPTPTPRTTSSLIPPDLRNTLHQIVGIELDRVEMRLNAKLEQLRIDMNSRLDQQFALLQQVLDAKNNKSSE
uniref:Uncharacterized protein n=1 Tax=Caenorhabditis japonica TaxID=281687 RepID=A0A8R1IHQ7_CAEJA